MDITKVRAARGKGVAIFTKFCQDKKGNENCLFCFFEGEDNKYYGSRIEQYTGYDYSQIISYNCGGRSEVQKAYDLISSKTENDKINKMFFIDADFVPLEKNSVDLYQTPCYSIENFYTSEECFGKILNREFGINVIDNDYKKCISDFLERQREFHENIVFFNAWLFCQRIEEDVHKNNAVKLSDFRISRLFSAIEIDKLAVKDEINKELIDRYFPDAYSIPDETLSAKYEEFSLVNGQQFFRGKFELEFLRKILESIIVKNKNRTYFSEYYNCVQLTPGANTISVLSDYADTPSCLIAFLKNHSCITANA